MDRTGDWEVLPSTNSLIDLPVLDNHEDYSVSGNLFFADNGNIVDANYFAYPPDPPLLDHQSNEEIASSSDDDGNTVDAYYFAYPPNSSLLGPQSNEITPSTKTMPLQEPNQEHGVEQAELCEDVIEDSVESSDDDGNIVDANYFAYPPDPPLLGPQSNEEITPPSETMPLQEPNQEQSVEQAELCEDVIEDSVESSRTDAALGKEERDHADLGVWGWLRNGIEAVCSVGVGAATVFAIALSSQHLQQRKAHFQVFTGDKRTKRAVRRVVSLNDVMSAVRGDTPARRAQISFGGYYDGLQSI